MARIGYDLRLLPSVNDVAGIPAEGKDMILVAAVENVLHFRVFDSDGKIDVDTDETKLTKQARQVDDHQESTGEFGDHSQAFRESEGAADRRTHGDSRSKRHAPSTATSASRTGNQHL